MTPNDHQWHAHTSSPFAPGSFADFSFSGQPASHLFVFAIALGLLFVSLSAAVLALTDKRLGWGTRILWALGNLTGFGKAILLWTAGGGDFFPISIQVPVMSLIHDQSAGWILTLGLPFVAVGYLVSRYLPSTENATHLGT